MESYLDNSGNKITEERLSVFEKHVEVRSNYTSDDVLTYSYAGQGTLDYHSTDEMERSSSLDIYWVDGEKNHLATIPHNHDDLKTYLNLLEAAESSLYDKSLFVDALRKMV